MIDYDVGDVVVKVAGKRNKHIGKMGRVVEIVDCGGSGGDGGLGVALAGFPAPRDDCAYWAASNFKKVPKADPGFIALIKAKKQPKRQLEPAG